MLKMNIAGIGIITPGINGWQQAQDVLLGKIPYCPDAELPALQPELLSANERRRTTSLIKLALSSAEQAIDGWAGNPAQLSSIFSCSCFELSLVDSIMNSLLLPEKPVSPTHFHNSVHNASAGYCSIATGSHAPATSLSARDHSFAAGLLEAATQINTGSAQVLLVAYDMPAPSALSSHHVILKAYAIALILTKADTNEQYATLQVEISGTGLADKMTNTDLELLRNANPAAHSLPLLRQIASKQDGSVLLPYLHGQNLKIGVTHC